MEVNDWARAHDDSPGTKHIVSWAGEGFAWPVEAYAFPPPDHVDLMALIREGRKANA